MLTKDSTKISKIKSTDNKISYLKDNNGRKKAVIVPIKLYKEYLEKYEDDLDIKVADSIMKNNPKFNKYSPDNYL
jgi:hypothetical protein